MTDYSGDESYVSSPTSCVSRMIIDEEDNNDNNDDHHDNLIITSISPPPFLVDDRVLCIGNATTRSSTGTKKKLSKHQHNNNNNNAVEYFEAIIRESRYRPSALYGDGSWQFLVHFIGWNKRWDRWIEYNSSNNDTDDKIDNITNNASIYRDTPGIRQQLIEQKKFQVGASNSSTLNANNNTSNKRRTQESTTSSKRNKQSAAATDTESSLIETLVYSDYCDLPLTLKTILMDEMERITRKGYETPNGYDDASKVGYYTRPPRLVHVLPAPVPIRKFIDHYIRKKSKEIERNSNSSNSSKSTPKNKQQNDATNAKQPSISVSDIQTFGYGLIELFEQAFPACLLYPQERPQYEYVKRKLQKQQANGGGENQMLADIYGCEYLLRLFVQLPILLQPSAELFLLSQASASSSTAATAPATTSAKPSSLHDPKLFGPLLTEVAVLLQTNKQTIFKVSGNYRPPIGGKEWLDWEYKVYSNNDDAATKNKKSAAS